LKIYRLLLLPTPSAALRERALMFPERALTFPERALTFPERALTFPERSRGEGIKL